MKRLVVEQTNRALPRCSPFGGIFRRSAAGSRCPQRAGSLVVEMVVCSIMLASVSLILVPAIHGVGLQRKAIRFETLAMIELGNLQQRLPLASDTNGSEANNAANSGLAISAWFLQRYPEARLEVTPVVADNVAGNESGDLMSAFRLAILQPAGTSKPDWNCSVVVWRPNPNFASVVESPSAGITPTEGITPSAGTTSSAGTALENLP